MAGACTAIASHDFPVQEHWRLTYCGHIKMRVPLAVQKQAAALRADGDELRSQIADLEEQLAESTAQLKVETTNRVNAQHEVDRANEGLESYMSKYIQLKEEYDERCEQYDDMSKKVRPTSAQALCIYSSIKAPFSTYCMYSHTLGITHDSIVQHVHVTSTPPAAIPPGHA